MASDAKNDVEINTEVSVNGSSIIVAEEVILVQKYHEVEQVNIKVKMIGIFESIGESIICDFNEFGKVNGAAIIFPFIREHITNITLKSGIGAIILPPVNFTNASK